MCKQFRKQIEKKNGDFPDVSSGGRTRKATIQFLNIPILVQKLRWNGISMNMRIFNGNSKLKATAAVGATTTR